MKPIVWVIAVLLVVVGCKSAERSVVDNAAAAIGGAERIQAVRTLVIEGAGENGNFGQSLSPDLLQVLRVTESKRSIDFAGVRTRLQQTRVATFGPPNPAPQRQDLALDKDVAYNVAADGTPTRASAQVAKDRRMEMLHHPIGALREAMATGAQLTNSRKEGSDDAVDVATAAGDRFTLYVDSTTKLPSKVVSTTANNVNWPIGDVTIATTFLDYMDVDGSKLPGRITSRIDQHTTADIRVSKYIINGDVGDLAAPEVARSAAAPGIPTPMVTAEEVVTGIWYLSGQSHHSVLVEFADHLVLIEAPQHEIRTGAVLDKMKELKPDKPLRYVINTHHHFDHSGGIRRVMAEDGVTIITHAGNKAFYEEVATRPHTIYPDTLSKFPKTPNIIGITEKYEIKDATRTVELYPIPNLHSNTMLMVYFPVERLLVEADLYTPPAPNAPPPPQGFPNAASVAESVQELGLRVDRIMPIHGFIVPYRNLEAAVRTTSTRR